MEFSYNEQFGKYLNEFSLPEDLDFQLVIPEELQEIIDSSIIETDLGITLDSLNKLRAITESWESVSIMEDFENHFHIDDYFATNEYRMNFMLGVKVLNLLALKFRKAHYSGIRFMYSYQTPKQAEEQSKHNGYHEEGDIYYINDRLSFHRRRAHEPLFDDLDGFPLEAILRIDI